MRATALLLASVFATALVSAKELTDADFEATTQAATGQTTGKWFVKFYAPWCGHCKSLAPDWDELAAATEVPGPLMEAGFNIAKVDCTENVELAKRFAIGGFPTLILFADRHMYIHNGERTLTSLKSFLLEVASGSYNSEAQAQVPAEPSWLGVQLRRDPFLAGLSEDFSHILEVRKNAAAVLVGMGAIAGVVVYALLATLCCGVSTSKPKAD